MQSTTGVYKPGIGYTITRANIKLIADKRAKEGLEPFDAAEMTAALVHYPRQRHQRRCALLMQPRPVTSRARTS
jgi:hypothetical protein